MRQITRRRALQEAALAVGAAGIGSALAPAATALAATTGKGGATGQVIPFTGYHQAGITSPHQPHGCVASLDVTGASERDLVALLRDWSAASARMTEGRTASGSPNTPSSPPADSGEALDLLPARLTITFGLGASLFSAVPTLRSRRPAALQQLPVFSTDNLQAGISGGDLCIQACADDPYVAFHSIRMLLAMATGRARLRWMLRGFLPTDQAQPQTPRNLMGFRDGTANPTPSDPFFEPTVWLQPSDDPAWLRGGSYLVVRRIRMRLGQWDASDFGEQEGTFGRVRSIGAPLTGGNEFTPPDFAAVANGVPVIPLDAHIRRANFSVNGGARLLRRGYMFGDGTATPNTGDLGSGGLDAGLLFLAYMRDPAQFIRIQSSLAQLDHLNEYIDHVGSALFAVPPGASPGGFVGETLLG